MKQTAPALSGPRAALLADLGAAYASRGDIDHACELLSDSLRVVVQGGEVARIRGIRGRYLSAAGDSPAVRRLDEELRLVATPTIYGVSRSEAG